MAENRYKYFDPLIAGRLANLSLVVRRAVEGFITGLHRSGHHGFSVEFSEHREYTPGDDLRHLDWVAYARSDRYYIKRYEQETNLRCHLLLDVSASMDYGYDQPVTKLQYGCFVAACLAYLMARQQDQVGMIAFDESVRFHLPPASTPEHLDRLFTRLERITPGVGTDLAPTFHELAERITKRGLIVILSDLYDDPDRLLNALGHFRYKKHQVILLHLLDRAELDLPHSRTMSFTDLETGRRMLIDPASVRDAYRHEMAAFIRRYRNECGDRGIDYLLTVTDTPYDRMLLHYLARRRRTKR